MSTNCGNCEDRSSGSVIKVRYENGVPKCTQCGRKVVDAIVREVPLPASKVTTVTAPAPADNVVPGYQSDGSTACYYELPNYATELQHLIAHTSMNAQIGEIFRACYRYGKVQHSPCIRDIKKIIFYAEAELERLERLAAATKDKELDAFISGDSEGLELDDRHNWILQGRPGVYETLFRCSRCTLRNTEKSDCLAETRCPKYGCKGEPQHIKQEPNEGASTNKLAKPNNLI